MRRGGSDRHRDDHQEEQQGRHRRPAGQTPDDRELRDIRTRRAAGIRIALDDFGTGYSSLRYLSRLPVDILKLDRGFVAELDGTAEGAAVAQAVLRLGQILHLDTVAEGVESDAQARELTLLGCNKAQGYHFARPMPAEDFDARFLASAAQ